MVDVRSGSEKLKDRARRMVNIITGLDYDAADALLRKAKWNVKAAVVMQKTGLPLEKAVTRVRKANGQLREALGEDIEAHLRELLGPAASKAE
jgi:N-acetylmuramic acid 6-phosphate etherase